MIYVCSVEVAASSPGRDNVERQTEAGACVYIAEAVVSVLDLFSRCAFGSVKWHNVVTESVRFVIVDDEGGDVMVHTSSDRLDDFTLQPRTVLGMVR